MNKHSNKLNITESKLFKDVSNVIGKVAALEELTKAYREYLVKSSFNWDEGLLTAFAWIATPQGRAYWYDLNQKLETLKLQKKGHLV